MLEFNDFGNIFSENFRIFSRIIRQKYHRNKDIEKYIAVKILY